MKPTHIKRSFASDYSRDAREGHLKDRGLETEILPEGINFCEHIGKYDCCKKPCFKKENEYCGVRNFIDKYEL